ncbi:hypothetical protein [Kluyvera sichuanensis]
MKALFVVASFIAITALNGCAIKNDETSLHGLGLTYKSKVEKLENGDYTTSVESAPAAGRISGATGTATQIATEYCGSQGKGMKVVKMETDSHYLINGVAHLTFQCN